MKNAIDTNRIKIVIIDDNVELCKIVSDFLVKSGKYEVLGVAYDGEKGLELLMDNIPNIDVALVDVVMPIKDGLYILEELARYPGSKPACIMFSGVNQDDITKKAIELGAAYFILKPFDMDLLIRRIEIVWNDRRVSTENTPSIHIESRITAEAYVANTLRRVPIPDNLKGYNYLKTSILMVIDNIELLQGVTKELYPAVGKKYRTTAECVERSMRHAIKIVWENEKYGYGANYYKLTGKGEFDGIKPTVRAFISAIVDQYNYEFKKVWR